MTSRQVFRVVGLIVASFGALLLVETGRVALALGAVATGPGLAPSPASGAFWFQLSFMRLFGVALIGLAALSLWGSSQLTAGQQRSLGLTLGGVFAGLAMMAIIQQVAIWSAMAGWGVASVFGIVAAMYGLSTIGRLSNHAV